jgi:hypothetical protein
MSLRALMMMNLGSLRVKGLDEDIARRLIARPTQLPGVWPPINRHFLVIARTYDPRYEGTGIRNSSIALGCLESSWRNTMIVEGAHSRCEARRSHAVGGSHDCSAQDREFPMMHF